MTANEALLRMNGLAESKDYEVAHCEADEILCLLILDLAQLHPGRQALRACVRQFKALHKWYA